MSFLGGGIRFGFFLYPFFSFLSCLFSFFIKSGQAWRGCINYCTIWEFGGGAGEMEMDSKFKTLE